MGGGGVFINLHSYEYSCLFNKRFGLCFGGNEKPGLTISTMTALLTPPAFSKAQGKLRSPAPSADFSMMKTAPNEPRRGAASVPRAGLYSRLMLRMLSRASSSMLPRAQLSTAGLVYRECNRTETPPETPRRLRPD